MNINRNLHLHNSDEILILLINNYVLYILEVILSYKHPGFYYNCKCIKCVLLARNDCQKGACEGIMVHVFPLVKLVSIEKHWALEMGW